MKIIVTIKGIDKKMWKEARREAIARDMTLGEYISWVIGQSLNRKKVSDGKRTN